MKVLLMGLGLHGGGLESARYLLRHGAIVTVTDLRDEKTLAASIEQLEASCAGKSAIRYVLGRHEIDDFRNADMVIKNPGVRPDSPYLQAARHIETDIGLFLAAIAQLPVRLIAVTGSKGKSSVSSALHWTLKKANNRSWLGGNITVSPLSFIDELQNGDTVTLELSSWQLGDLRGRTGEDGLALLKPKAAVLTAIMPDHLDRYGAMEAYIDDKRIIYRGQDSGDITVAGDDEWGRSFLAESGARPLVYSNTPLPKQVSGGWIDADSGRGFARLYNTASQGALEAQPVDGEIAEIVPDRLLVPGRHQKQNLLAAGLALYGLGMNPEHIRKGLGSFPGVEHRLELFLEAGGIAFYNDSAATIPEAAAAAVEALGSDGRLILVTGGTDKNLDFSPLVSAAKKAKAVILLAGSGSDKLRALLDNAGLACLGPFDALENAANAALELAAPGDRIALSPGCASFGMFLNEFDRGRKWKETIKGLGTRDWGSVKETRDAF
ncbi:MAG: UDP-N-acetylmuramoyl-L-alanine--D-glutamate ligase [Treponema sp.]|nr:UDP-N-acetylmuramoyl-L-alanine--D-glutamate ligase [Treponema sp.]